MIETVTALIESVPTWFWVASNLALGAIAFLVRQRYAAKLEKLRADLRREHEVELQNLRRDHELEIDRRKKQYDSKRQQFERYWLLLDNYARKQRDAGYLDQIMGAFNECAAEFMESIDDPSKSAGAFSKMMDALQVALRANTDEYMEVRQETQSLRLVAGEKLYQMLTELDRRLEEAFDTSNSLVSGLTNLQAHLENPQLMEQTAAQQAVIQKQGEELSALYLAVMEEMRRELNQS